MIFVGDIALPFKDAITVENLPSSIKRHSWYGNLEGALVDDHLSKNYNHSVFNSISAIEKLCEDFPFFGFSLANNHIFDTGSIEQTTEFLKKRKISFGGIGENIEQANRPIVKYENGKQIVIINFGWEVIQCKVATVNQNGVNPLNKNHVIETVSKLILEYPNAVVIPFMHWSYELESEPQPFERELAKKLIDIGAGGVIGCHPHRIGGFELHNGKPIVYSLGNWMFKQNYYHNGLVSFPAFCNEELAFEWCFDKNEFRFHFFSFDKTKSILSYSHTEENSSKTMSKLTPFVQLSNNQYKTWYSKNHFHKNKGLPIYYFEDAEIVTLLKNKMNKFRDFLIKLIIKFKRK
ncbi:MAG: CapA family protein [Flavobacteriales bacterium]|nr:CapA family protein [Flavobacteriales bacterium]